MKKKKKKEQINGLELFGRGATYVYLVVMLGLFPVFYKGDLFGISDTKRMFFIISTVAYLGFIFMPVAGNVLAWLKDRQKIKFDSCDKFALVLLVAIIASTLFAIDRKEAIYGSLSGKVGAIVMMLGLLSYFAVKKFARYDTILIWINLFASLFIYLSGVLITCQFDILNMQKGIIDEQKSVFVSPLGNIDYNVAYISLVLPATMVMFLLCKEAFTKRVLFVYLHIGFMDILCLRTESSIVMLAVVFIACLYFALENELWLKQYAVMVQLYISANVMVWLLKILLKDRMYVFDGLGALLIRNEIIILEIILFILLFFFHRKKFTIIEERLRQLHKIYGIVLVTLFVGVTSGLLLLNTVFRNQVMGTGLEKLVLGDLTFTRRGYAYIRTAWEYAKLPILNKIFGCGLSCYYYFISASYRDEMIALYNAVFYDPHNDFLFALVTMGITGVIGFFGMIFSTIASAMKNRKDREMQIMSAASLIAFLIQGLVNSYTIFCIPILFLVLGLAYSKPKTED